MRDVVYLVRDGRNAMISHLFLTYLWGGHQISRLDEIRKGLGYLTERGHFWADHVNTALREVDRRKVVFIKYEDLIDDPVGAVGAILRFLGANVSPDMLQRGVEIARAQKAYFEQPSSGYLYQPSSDSIYYFLQRYRQEDYWRHIFDDEATRFFHERGGTKCLLRFGYEQSDEWWQERTERWNHITTEKA